MTDRPGKAYPKYGVRDRKFKVKLVEIIKDPEAAKLISDPMRRAILNLLRQRPLTEAELADSLGLTDATVNYHLGLLKKADFLSFVRGEVEEHGIMQKFYAPTAYLYLPDVKKLPKEVARYYYPLNIERVRGVLSGLNSSTEAEVFTGRDVDELGEEFATALVEAAKKYAQTEVAQGEGELLVKKLYAEALEGLRRPK
jgi:DNA-binding transcriptional ArsR family regulator